MCLIPLQETSGCQDKMGRVDRLTDWSKQSLPLTSSTTGAAVNSDLSATADEVVLFHSVPLDKALH